MNTTSRIPYGARYSLAAVCFVLAGLLGRALIDKLLSIQGGAAAVAGWAQLSSLAEVVSGVSLAGVGTALTVLSAGSTGDQRLRWLKPGLVVSLLLSLAVAVVAFGFLRWSEQSIVPTEGPSPVLALMTGWLLVAPGLVIALLLGLKHPARATVVAILGNVLPFALLLWGPWNSALANLLVGQAAFGLAFSIGLLVFLCRHPPLTRQTVRSLLQFVPAGLAIGILSPAATAWARVEMAEHLSWHAAGQVQAIWRASDWITMIMAGLLNAHFLPRLSAAVTRDEFISELRLAAWWILAPAGVCLAALWFCLSDVFSVLYSAGMDVARADAVFFLVGDWVRILSWVALFGLFARRAAWAITWGELLSLPLFALLLAVFADRLGLQEVGAVWLFSYLAYACFNIVALGRSIRDTGARIDARQTASLP